MQVTTVTEQDQRKEILKRKLEFDTDPLGFSRKWQRSQKELRKKILKAKAILTKIKPTEENFQSIVDITSPLNLDGHRADIVMMKASRALAAFRARDIIEKEDIKDAARLALGHRLKRLPFEDIKSKSEKLQSLIAGI